jgi:hypothetical protein
MGTILVPLFAHYRPAAPPVQAAYAEGLRSIGGELKAPLGGVDRCSFHAVKQVVVEPIRAPLVGAGVELARPVYRTVTEKLPSGFGVVGMRVEPIVRREVAHDVRI